MITNYKHYLNETNKHHNFYKNIDIIEEMHGIKYYNIPFDICTSEKIFDDGEYSHCFISNFVYDYITDEDIEKYLKTDLSEINIEDDWINDKNYNSYEHASSNNERHAKRIAKLVNEIKKNKPLKPCCVFFDPQSYQYDIFNNVEDGNHRIRALQYLKYDGFPAYIGGSHSKILIEYLKTLNN